MVSCMQFDIAIGNPPYQHNTKTIYSNFVILGIRISKQHISMITRNNWLVNIINKWYNKNKKWR